MKRKKKLFLILLFVGSFCLVAVVRLVKLHYEIEEVFPAGGVLYVIVKEPGEKIEELRESFFWKEFSKLKLWDNIGMEFSILDDTLSNEILRKLMGKRAGIILFASPLTEGNYLLLFDLGIKGSLVSTFSGRRKVNIPYNELIYSGVLYGNILAISENPQLIRMVLEKEKYMRLTASAEFRKIISKLPEKGDLLYVDKKIFNVVSQNVPAEATIFPLSSGMKVFEDNGHITVQSYFLTGREKLSSEKFKVAKPIGELKEEVFDILGVSPAWMYLGIGAQDLIGLFRGKGDFSAILFLFQEDTFQWSGDNMFFAVIDAWSENAQAGFSPVVAFEVEEVAPAVRFFEKLGAETEIYKDSVIYSKPYGFLPGYFCVVNNFLTFATDLRATRAIIDGSPHNKSYDKAYLLESYERGAHAFFYFDLDYFFGKNIGVRKLMRASEPSGAGALFEKQDIIDVLSLFNFIKSASGNIFLEEEGIRTSIKFE